VRRLSFAPLLAIPFVIELLPPIPVRAQEMSFAGAWTLNRSLSDVPKEMGFSVNWMPVSSGGQAAAPSGGVRGRRGGGGRSGPLPAGAFAGSRESYDEAQRRQFLTGEARNPPPRLTITETPSALSITDDQGRARTLSTTAIQQMIDLQGVTLAVRTTHAPDRYIVLYEVEQDRKLRFTYSRVASPPQMIVDVEFLEHGTPGDKARLVYEPGTADPVSPPTTAPAAMTTAAGAAKTATGRPAETFDQRPGGELKGLKSLGVVVEDLSKQAIACGLNQRALEAAMSKRLTAGGLSVRRNADDDTYLYINIKTDQLPSGSCLSRYDASLYTHTTAKLSYGDRSVLVRVELMHRGGIANSGAGQHGQAITNELENDVDRFVMQIRVAN
jgi:hypothetical protein